VALESDRDEFRVGRMGMLYLRRLAEAETAGVEWFPGTRYECSTADDGGSAVWLSQRGRRFRVKTRLLIGADGAGSRVAQHLSLDANRAHLIGVEDVVEAACIEGPPALHCFLDPELAPGYIAWLAYDGEAAHIGVAGYAHRFAPLDALRSFSTRLRESGVCDTRCARRIERRGGRIPVNGILPRIANGRGLLVGDAAGAVSPLTAGGLDPCLRLSWYAAEVASQVLASGSLAALSGYSGAMFRRRFRSRLLMRRVLSSVRSRALAELVVQTLSMPPFRALANHIFFSRGSFPVT
jgi:flavin-dependent dehydrogenase